jgi:hypothetical protein
MEAMNKIVIAGAMALLVLSYAPMGNFASAKTATPIVAYPFALSFSFRIDPANNYWYVNATNFGSKALAQVGFGVFNSKDAQITENSTALLGIPYLLPGDTIQFKTICSDYYYSGTPCKFVNGESYLVDIVSWANASCECSPNQYGDLTGYGHITANNDVYTFTSYPAIELSYTTTVTTKDWSITIFNHGTSAFTHVRASVEWYWPCSRPACGSATKHFTYQKIPAGGKLTRSDISVTKPHEPTSFGATVEVMGTYSFSGWSVQFIQQQSVKVT